jgi:hypothetical protein
MSSSNQVYLPQECAKHERFHVTIHLMLHEVSDINQYDRSGSRSDQAPVGTWIRCLHFHAMRQWMGI